MCVAVDRQVKVAGVAGSWKRTIAVSNQSRSRNANRHGFTMQAMGSTKSAVTSDVTIIIVATLK
eukprot:COSAG06_NODE_57332_length_280_cov_1.723757_1_plen_63_part_01